MESRRQAQNYIYKRIHNQSSNLSRLHGATVRPLLFLLTTPRYFNFSPTVIRQRSYAIVNTTASLVTPSSLRPATYLSIITIFIYLLYSSFIVHLFKCCAYYECHYFSNKNNTFKDLITNTHNKHRMELIFVGTRKMDLKYIIKISMPTIFCR